MNRIVEVNYYTMGVERLNILEDMKLRYFIDEDDEFWYMYEDICELIDLEYGSQKSMNILYKEVYEWNRTTCIVTNYQNKYNETTEATKVFIDSNAVRKLIERNNKRNSKIIQEINNLETLDHSFKRNNDLDEWNARVEKLNESIEHKNFEEIAYQSYKLNNMKTSRDILDKAGIIDKEKEELVDILRYEVYSYDPEYVEIKLAKRVKENEAESKTVPLSKSTCPEWLMDVVKNSK